MRIRILIFCGILVFQIVFASGRIYSYDELVVAETTENLIQQSSSALDPTPDKEQYAKYGRDGGLYSRFGMGMSAALIPFHLLGVAVFANAVFIALIAVVFYNVLIRSNVQMKAAVIVTLMLSFSTLIAPYGRGLFNEVLTGLALLLAYSMLISHRPFFVGMAASIAFATRAEYLLIVPLLAFFTGRKNLLHFFVPVMAMVGLLALYNYARFGNPFDNGMLSTDSGDTFSTPLQVGLYGLLISPGKGILWYSPPILLALFGMRKFKTIIVIVIPMIILQASWHAWAGGWCYGPRRFVALLPLLMLPAGFIVQGYLKSSRGRMILIVLALVGFMMQIGGLTTNFMTYHQEAKGSLLWSVRHSAALGQVRDLLLKGREDLLWW